MRFEEALQDPGIISIMQSGQYMHPEEISTVPIGRLNNPHLDTKIEILGLELRLNEEIRGRFGYFLGGKYVQATPLGFPGGLTLYTPAVLLLREAYDIATKG